MEKFYVFKGRIDYTVVNADSSAEALNIFRQDNPDTFILFIESEEEFQEMNELYVESFKDLAHG